MTVVLPRWALEPVPDTAAARDLADSLRIPEALAALMVQRGFGTSERARAFLRPSLSDLSDPFSLAGMDQAVETVAAAVKAGRTILVHGDYDVDGQCSTAVLTRAGTSGTSSRAMSSATPARSRKRATSPPA
jgi:single-stranded-DNA-specific exonuclease